MPSSSISVLKSGGRTEFYPEDRTAMLTLLNFKNQRMEKESRRLKQEQERNKKMKELGLSTK
jgi:hypothetical protein